MRVTVLALLSLVVFTGCQTTKLALEPTAYDYTAYDADGNIVVTGTLRMKQTGDSVDGDWSFAPAEGVRFADVGPQLGDGRLGGKAGDKVVVLNLQPGTIDNHVILRGRLRNSLFSGWWQYVGFGGVVSEGAFAAKAQ